MNKNTIVVSDSPQTIYAVADALDVTNGKQIENIWNHPDIQDLKVEHESFIFGKYTALLCIPSTEGRIEDDFVKRVELYPIRFLMIIVFNCDEKIEDSKVIDELIETMDMDTILQRFRPDDFMNYSSILQIFLQIVSSLKMTKARFNKSKE